LVALTSTSEGLQEKLYHHIKQQQEFDELTVKVQEKDSLLKIKEMELEATKEEFTLITERELEKVRTMFGAERSSYCNKIQTLEEKITGLEQMVKQKEQEMLETQTSAAETQKTITKYDTELHALKKQKIKLTEKKNYLKEQVTQLQRAHPKLHSAPKNITKKQKSKSLKMPSKKRSERNLEQSRTTVKRTTKSLVQKREHEADKVVTPTSGTKRKTSNKQCSDDEPAKYKKHRKSICEIEEKTTEQADILFDDSMLKQFCDY